MSKRILLSGLALLAAGAAVTAQVIVTAPLVSSVNPTDVIQIVPGGIPSVGNVYAQAQYLSGYFGQGQAPRINALIAGDATQNLFQRATTGSSVSSTTPVYGGPDRWAYWSGASTALTVSRSSTAADLAVGYKYAYKMARTSGQTGILPVCMAQVVESASSYQFAGKTAEFDFNANTGANFSPANGNVTASIVYGTGTDEGVSSLQAGTWTGQANATAAVISLGGVSTVGRYAAIGNVPATATEIAVQICWTPVGTAGTNDYVALNGLQLIATSANATYANTTVGYSAAAATGPTLAAFERRPLEIETGLQQRYYYALTETAAITPVATCAAVDTTHTNCLVQFPVTMRTTPTATYANGFASPTTTSQATLGACTTLASAATVASTALNPLNVLVNCTATTIPAAGVASFLYSNNGTGAIKLAAEL